MHNRGVVATVREHAERLGVSTHAVYRRVARATPAPKPRGRGARPMTTRANHLWNLTGDDGALRCVCGAERLGAQPRYSYRVSRGAWQGVPPLCNRKVYAPRAVAPTPTTVDALYLSLDERARLVLGACILTVPRLSYVEVGRILGVSYQAVEQSVERIRGRASRVGIELPPPQPGHQGPGRMFDFRRAAHARLGSRTRDARALDDARDGFIGLLVARIRQQARWCPRCEAWKPIGEFYESTLRTRGDGSLSCYCIECHLDYCARRAAVKPWSVCIDCLTEPVADGSTRCAGCTEAMDRRIAAGNARAISSRHWARKRKI